MITGRIDECERYYPMHPLFREAFEAYKRLTAEKTNPGIYDIQGKKLYASVQEYTTKHAAEIKFETHRKYIDVQFLSSGEEFIPYADRESLEGGGEYDENEDIIFYSAPPANYSRIYLKAGDFAVFFPEDGHAPRIAVSSPAHVNKIVIKVMLNC